MFRPVRLGRPFGIPVELAPSFFLVLLLALFMGGGGWGVALAAMVFASVLVHELGHALVARRLDVRTDSIELHFFGGAAKLIDAPRTPGHEIAIAAAGPAVSFAIAGVAAGLVALFGGSLLAALAWVNLLIGAFNLLPALPMDGGRILRAALARRMPFARATRIAVTVARWVAGGLAVVGIAQGSLYLFALAVLVWMMGSRELLVARFGGGHYRDRPEVEVLPRDWPRAQAGRGFVVRAHDGRLVVESVD